MNDYWCIPPRENAEFVAAMSGKRGQQWIGQKK